MVQNKEKIKSNTSTLEVLLFENLLDIRELD